MAWPPAACCRSSHRSGQPCSFVIKDRDHYGRTDADILRNGQSITLRMVRAGQAVACRQNLRKCDATAYLGAERAAEGNIGTQAEAEPAESWAAAVSSQPPTLMRAGAIKEGTPVQTTGRRARLDSILVVSIPIPALATLGV